VAPAAVTVTAVLSLVEDGTLNSAVEVFNRSFVSCSMGSYLSLRSDRVLRGFENLNSAKPGPLPSVAALEMPALDRPVTMAVESGSNYETSLLTTCSSLSGDAIS